VYCGIPEIASDTFIGNGIDRNRLFHLEPPVSRLLEKYLNRILRKAYLLRNPVNTIGIFEKLSEQRTSLKSKIIYDFPAYFFSGDSLFTLLEKLVTYLSMRSNKKCLSKIIEIDPIFVMATANVVESEWSIIRAAQAMGIKTYTHILSFDNLTSRGYLPVSKFDKYFVWNEKMKEELIKYYSVSSYKIFITGTPQFDFHSDKISRGETLERIGLEAHEKYVVYCANHFAISPNEPELLEYILEKFHGTADLKGFRLVLRLHPMDDYNRWNQILDANPSVILSTPWKHLDNDTLFWGEPNFDDLVLFSNILRHACVMLNIASTVSIDASITDTPVICIGFHPTKTVESDFYRDVHYTEHYREIMDCNALPLATSLDNLIILIKEQIDSPKKYGAERVSLKNMFFVNHAETSKSLILNLLSDDSNS
jgi:hypothetical protein